MLSRISLNVITGIKMDYILFILEIFFLAIAIYTLTSKKEKMNKSKIIFSMILIMLAIAFFILNDI